MRRNETMAQTKRIGILTAGGDLENLVHIPARIVSGGLFGVLPTAARIWMGAGTEIKAPFR